MPSNRFSVSWRLAIATSMLGLLAANGVSPAEFYRYDEAGRLVEVLYGDGNAIRYTYDANSNVLSIQVIGDELFKDGFE